MPVFSILIKRRNLQRNEKNLSIEVFLFPSHSFFKKNLSKIYSRSHNQSCVNFHPQVSCSVCFLKFSEMIIISLFFNVLYVNHHRVISCKNFWVPIFRENLFQTYGYQFSCWKASKTCPIHFPLPVTKWDKGTLPNSARKPG